MAKKRTGYWYEIEEAAVVDYLSTDDPEEKQRIYKDKLEYPLSKMIESLIRRYRLYNPEMEEDKLQKDSLSFLITKFDKFNPDLDGTPGTGGGGAGYSSGSGYTWGFQGGTGGSGIIIIRYAI